MESQRIIRRHGLCAMTRLSMATIYRLIQRGDFPKPIRLSLHAVGWDIVDVDAWIQSRKAASRKGAM